MVKVLVLAGGTSSERDVSLRSGQAVMAALETAGYTTGVADPAAEGFDVAQATAGYEVVFSVLHGKGGEDGIMQAQLDRTGIAYVGTDTAASELCFDKSRYRAKLSDAGLPVARGELIDAEGLWQSELSQHPFVLKPNDGGSSIDTFIIRDVQRADKAAIAAAFGRHPKMLLETLVEGIEITVGVLGDTALPVIEIIPPTDGEFDYENKYNGQSQELCPPQHVDESTQQAAQKLAAEIHQLCGCGGYSRTDMIVAPDGSLVVLETNTLPGMTDQSLFPKAAAAAGITMPELCDRLVKYALTNRTGDV